MNTAHIAILTYPCTECAVCKVFIILQQLDNSLDGPHRAEKNLIIQTKYKSFTELTHPLLYRITLIQIGFPILPLTKRALDKFFYLQMWWNDVFYIF